MNKGVKDGKQVLRWIPFTFSARKRGRKLSFKVSQSWFMYLSSIYAILIQLRWVLAHNSSPFMPRELESEFWFVNYVWAMWQNHGVRVFKRSAIWVLDE